LNISKAFPWTTAAAKNPACRGGKWCGNCGAREGAGLTQVYLGDSHTPLPWLAKGLEGLTGKLPSWSVVGPFSYYDIAKHDCSTAPGEFGILVRSSSMDTGLQGKYSLGSGEENR
jgi:hypothetical protein